MIEIVTQEQISRWHALKFPTADLTRVGLKLGEEAGEVQRALIRIIEIEAGERDGDIEEWQYNLAGELGDTLVTLNVIASRRHINLDDAFQRQARAFLKRVWKKST